MMPESTEHTQPYGKKTQSCYQIKINQESKNRYMIRYIVLRYTDKPDSLRDLTAKSNHKY